MDQLQHDRFIQRNFIQLGQDEIILRKNEIEELGFFRANDSGHTILDLKTSCIQNKCY